MAVWRWSARLLGAITTVLVARWLYPEDFGLVALALIVVAMSEVVVELGTDAYVIRLEDPQREDYDTAWTLRLLLVVAVSALVFLGAKPLSAILGDARAYPVLTVLSAATVLRGAVNIGVTILKRDLRYRAVALAGLTQRTVWAVSAIGFTWYLDSYWGLVVAEVALRIVEVVLSYRIHPHRPRLELSRVASQWKFCRWILVRNLALYLQTRGDQLIAGGLFGTGPFGFYAIAARIAALPTRELMAPTITPVYAGLSKIRGAPAEFNTRVTSMVGASCIVVLPAVAWIALHSEVLIGVLLGERWAPAAALVGPLLVAEAALALSQNSSAVLTITGRVRVLAGLHWLGALGLSGVVLAAASLGGIEAAVHARAVGAIGVLGMHTMMLARCLELPVTNLLAPAGRPVLACGAMTAMAYTVATADWAPWVEIAASGTLGAAAYLTALALAWIVAGRPASGERLLLGASLRVMGRDRRPGA